MGTSTRAVLSLLVAALAYATAQMLIIPALPAIQVELGTGPDEIAWAISAFLMSTAVSASLAGRCGDLYGKRRVLVWVLAIFSVGGLLGAVAPNVEVLIAARTLQGVGGAVFPLSYGMARDILPPTRVPVAIGLISGSFGVGGTAGLVLSGPLVDQVAWQSTLALGAAIGLLAIVCVLRFIPASKRGPRVPLDVGGGLLMTAGVILLLLGIAGHVGPSTAIARAGSIAGGLAVLVVWWAWELRQAIPLVDVRLIRRRDVWPVNAVGALIGFGMYAMGFLVPQLVQADPAATDVGFGGSVTTTSLYLLPALISGLGAGALSGLLDRGRYGSSLPFGLGVALMGVGYAVVIAATHSTFAVAIGVLLAHGIGLNLALAAMANLIVQAAPAARVGEAAGTNTTIRTIGGAVGIQIVALAMLAPSGDAHTPSAAGFDLAFGICAALMVAGVALLAASRAIGHRSAPPFLRPRPRRR